MSDKCVLHKDYSDRTGYYLFGISNSLFLGIAYVLFTTVIRKLSLGGFTIPIQILFILFTIGISILLLYGPGYFYDKNIEQKAIDFENSDNCECNRCILYAYNRGYNMLLGWGISLTFTGIIIYLLRGNSGNTNGIGQELTTGIIISCIGVIITVFFNTIYYQWEQDNKYYSDKVKQCPEGQTTGTKSEMKECGNCEEIKSTKTIYTIAGFISVLQTFVLFLSANGCNNTGSYASVLIIFSIISLLLLIFGFIGFEDYLKNKNCTEIEKK